MEAIFSTEFPSSSMCQIEKKKTMQNKQTKPPNNQDCWPATSLAEQKRVQVISKDDWELLL